MKIEALHDFHDPEFSQAWADRFTPNPDRTRLFQDIQEQIAPLISNENPILELGIGPGYLAVFLLEQLTGMRYVGLDFSQAMLDIAQKRTRKYIERIAFCQADLVKENWPKKLSNRPAAIVSTWALHDLFQAQNILKVYRDAYECLAEGGVLLNGDFIKPEESDFEYEGGRIKPSEQLVLLQKAGFSKVECLAEYEKSVDNPTTANNYALFKAVK